MKVGFLAAVGGAAIVIAGLAGCSSDKESSSATQTAAAGEGTAKVVIDGADQNVEGTIACTSQGGTVNIAIGNPTQGIGAVVTEGDSPTVQSVALGNVGGAQLGYAAGDGQGNAEATKDGNTYKIKGTATGIDTANPLQPVNKPFEIEVTCP